jgi:hypothetical protein
VAYFKLLFQYSSRGTEENHKRTSVWIACVPDKIQTGYSVSLIRSFSGDKRKNFLKEQLFHNISVIKNTNVYYQSNMEI